MAITLGLIRERMARASGLFISRTTTGVGAGDGTLVVAIGTVLGVTVGYAVRIIQG